MTRTPPPSVPGAPAGAPDPDPARDRYLDAFVAAYVRHERILAAEARRYAAECAVLRGRYRAARAAAGRATDHERNYQATLDEITSESER